MSEFDVVTLARLQFAATALYHFLFVPLTLGLSFLLAIMESAYVMTRREIWRDMTRFWGKLFGINFAMGGAPGITMEFQFGTNWAYYSHYVGDIFGAPLALEGLMAFFLEATFIGLFFFGWDRLSRLGHLAVTWLVALGSNLLGAWSLLSNGPEHTSLWAAYSLLPNRPVAFARRSIIVASAFGLASALCVVVLGDESGYTLSDNQKVKLAAIEAMWKTEAAPAGLTLVGFPDLAAHETRYGIKVPWVLGVIATRSFDQQIAGLEDLVGVAR